MVQALTLRAAAGHAAAAGYWKRVEGFARPTAERSPPMGVGSQPTPSRMVRISPPLPTSPWACAHTTPSTCKVARARTSIEQAHTRTRATREEPGRDSRVRHWARLRHTSDDAGSGRATTPGDHAANLGATMLDTCYTRLRWPTSRRRTRHAVHLESTLLLSIQNALALISSLYYTHAPQLLTRRRQRVRHTSTFTHQAQSSPGLVSNPQGSSGKKCFYRTA